MEGRCQCLALAHQHGIFAFGCDYFYSRTRAFNFGSANEDHLNRLIEKAPLADGAVDLPAIGIATYGNVERAQASLLWVLDFGREQDASGAGSEGRLQAHKIFQF